MAASTAADFGAPVYDNPAADPATTDAAAQHQLVDMNDPRLVSEVLDDNTAADAYEVPPPAPDGKWRAKLKIVPIKNDAGQAVDFAAFSRQGIDNGTAFFAVNVEASLIDLGGKYDGIKLTEYWVKSNIDGRKGTSQMTTIGQKAGGQFPAKSNQMQRLQAFQKALAGEPEVIIDTVWEAQCQACQEKAKKAGEKAPRPFLYGMHRFPQTRVAGVHDPNVPCPTCHAMARAQVRINQYFSVKESKATRGLA